MAVLIFTLGGLIGYQTVINAYLTRETREDQKWLSTAIQAEFLSSDLTHQLMDAIHTLSHHKPLSTAKRTEIEQTKAMLLEELALLQPQLEIHFDSALRSEMESILLSLRTTEPLLNRFQHTIATASLIDHFAQDLRRKIRYHREETTNTRTNHVLVVEFLFYIVLGLITLTFFYTRTLAQRINGLNLVAKKIQEGNTETRAETEGNDELTALADSFNRMTEKLIDEKQFVEKVISSMGEMLVIVDGDGTMRDVNAACLDSCAYTKEEMTGKPVSILFKRPYFFNEFSENIKKYGFQKDVSAEIYRNGGTHFSASISGSAIYHTNGLFTGIALIMKDQTGFKMLLEESQARAAAEASAQIEKEKALELSLLNFTLKETQEQMIEAGKFAALGEMASGIAHEINNPLTIIHGKAGQIKDLLEVSPLDMQKIRTHAEKIESTAMRAAKAIHNLRAFSQDGRNEPLTTVPLAKILEEALCVCREKLKNHGIDLRIRPFPENLAIECREMQISQVFLSLLGTAQDSVEEIEDKWIQIEAIDGNAWLEIWVTDSGQGSPSPQPTTRPNKSKGLGLSISRGIVESHHGSLRLDPSHPNRRFIVRLPKTQPEENAAA